MQKHRLSFVVYKRLLRYLKPLLWLFIGSIIANILYSGVDAYFIKLLQPLIDEGFVNNNTNVIRLIPIVLPLLFLFRGLFNFIANYSMFIIGRKIVIKLRQELFAHYLKLPISYLDQVGVAKLLSVMLYNVNNIMEAVTSAITDGIRQGALIIFLITVMFINSYQLTVLLLLITPIISIIFRYANRKFRYLSNKLQNSMADITHISEESLANNKEIKIFGSYNFEISKFNRALNDFYRNDTKLALVKFISIPTIQILGGISFAVIIYLSLNAKGLLAISAGAFASFCTSVIAIFKPMKQLSLVSNQIQTGLAGAESIFEILNEKAEYNNYNNYNINNKLLIEYKNINFHYQSNTSKAVLKNINFNLCSGDTIAIVGKSGSGKSTIADLLLRLYEDYTGEILLNKINIKNYNLLKYRDLIAMVSQKVQLFNASIADNIIYGSEYNQNILIDVARKANILDFINGLPYGFDTIIGAKGILLSGGQRQRIAIARALFKNSPVLILDEATSALDNESERLIQSALFNLRQDKLILIIAHRLSTIINADKIIVLEEGQIINIGSHAELLDSCRYYANLYNTGLTEHEDASKILV